MSDQMDPLLFRPLAAERDDLEHEQHHPDHGPPRDVAQQRQSSAGGSSDDYPFGREGTPYFAEQNDNPGHEQSR